MDDLWDEHSAGTMVVSKVCWSAEMLEDSEAAWTAVHLDEQMVAKLVGPKAILWVVKKVVEKDVSLVDLMVVDLVGMLENQKHTTYESHYPINHD